MCPCNIFRERKFLQYSTEAIDQIVIDVRGCIHIGDIFRNNARNCVF